MNYLPQPPSVSFYNPRDPAWQKRRFIGNPAATAKDTGSYIDRVARFARLSSAPRDTLSQSEIAEVYGATPPANQGWQTPGAQQAILNKYQTPGTTASGISAPRMFSAAPVQPPGNAGQRWAKKSTEPQSEGYVPGMPTGWSGVSGSNGAELTGQIEGYDHPARPDSTSPTPAPMNGNKTPEQMVEEERALFMARGGSQRTMNKALSAEGRKPAIDARATQARGNTNASDSIRSQWGWGVDAMKLPY